MTIESALDHAKRAFALKKYEHAVDHYATALELMYARCPPRARTDRGRIDALQDHEAR